MTSATLAVPPARNRDVTGPPVASALRWWLLGLLALAGAATAFVTLVLTTTGHRIENAALRGADQVDAALVAESDAALDAITVTSLAVASVLVVLIALARKRPDLAIAASTIIVVSSLITQVLKRIVLQCPELIEVTGPYASNSFPSGHTTIAASILFALLIVVPFRWRGIAMFVAATYAVAMGAHTLTSKWHRFSDVLGANLLTLGVACLVTAALVHRGSLMHVTAGRYPLRIIFVVIPIALSTIATILIGALLLVLSDIPAVPDATLDYNMYLALHGLAAGSSGLVFLLFWWTWRRVDIAEK
ncbi:phosphatase PAP2 family protein [Hoyosella sp. G463]|uniref:Phosphatase PAP2 family protein n=1 Tax=Lolliginicoccus lacisalsi TaxID=2742202 RepID=A0A927JBW9_9ACTN|nr:phosphatase PAP2 family protein [Lolliginicoccus lacisalsi]MBD8506469.1 phosphatase PAP2 family protein [Lolliginicoccus lacisalsi]